MGWEMCFVIFARSGEEVRGKRYEVRSTIADILPTIEMKYKSATPMQLMER